ncbi:TPA: 50S ribosome-binding GTPase [Vibrio parahaemolyticus]|nr:DUF697 domain-containing protein [Vibrio vulnificus]HCG7110317.1 50S ribosome-binding GTPase [Vibrio parahaemolyticus]HCH0353256.1 50S ribosome-binding GTPase [Vibrio parahaemolyticus]
MMSISYEDYLGDSFDPQTGEFDSGKAKEQVNESKDKFNIILMGATGVGKSSLVNAFFGEDIVKTGVGKPVTQHLQKVEVPSKGMTLWDTKGIESKDYKATLEQLRHDLHQALKNANSLEDLPHLGWLCIDASSSRIEDRDLELLSILKENNIPAVVVFTKVIGKSRQPFIDEAKNLINSQYKQFVSDRFAAVNSVPEEISDEFIVPVKGLDTLLDLSLECIPAGKKTAASALKKAQRVKNELRRDAMIDSSKSKVHIAAGASATVGASPIPGSDAPLIAAIQSKLIYEINSEFEVDSSTSTSSSIIVGVLGITAVAQVAKTTVTTILKFIPGAGTIAGGIVSASTAFAFTEAIGHAYIKVMEHYFDLDSGTVKLPDNTDAVLDIFKTYFSYKK